MITDKKVRREEKKEIIATTPITLNQTVAPVLSFFKHFFLKHQPFNEFFNVIQISLMVVVRNIYDHRNIFNNEK